MLRRHLILSTLLMPALPTIVLGSARKVCVAYVRTACAISSGCKSRGRAGRAKT